jgi:chromosome segregation ATPase
MNHPSTSLPDDPDKLKELVIELRDQINELKSEVTTKNARIDHQSNTINQLIEAIALARQQYFGSRGQKVDADSMQLSWLFNEAEALADQDSDGSSQDDDEPGVGKKQTAPRKRQTGGRKKLPEHFPRSYCVRKLSPVCKNRIW